MGVEVQIANPDLLLKPGMYARVEVVLEIEKGALLIPLEALDGSEANASVLVVREGKATRVPVRLGAADGPRVQIRTGLTGDDQVIVQGKDLVREGAAVKAIPAKSY
jgi:multidrug efflux pump subunit AcrA (membrane-fusion protein)